LWPRNFWSLLTEWQQKKEIILWALVNGTFEIWSQQVSDNINRDYIKYFIIQWDVQQLDQFF